MIIRKGRNFTQGDLAISGYQPTGSKTIDEISVLIASAYFLGRKDERIVEVSSTEFREILRYASVEICSANA